MSLQVKDWKYKYYELPKINEEADIAAYVAVAKKYFPRRKKAPKRVEIPEFDNPVAQRNWEHEEIRRCIEGHDGMPGKYYFYYNYCWIKNISGGFIQPQFRMADATWFHLIESCEPQNYNRGKGVICVKRRRAGFTWKEACDGVHDGLFKEGANIGMTSKSEDNAKELFGMCHVIYERLPKFLKHPISSKTKESISFSRKSTDELGTSQMEGNNSLLFCRPPTDSCFEGGMLNKMIIDEVGKIDNALTIWAMSRDCLMEEMERVGVPLLFGTAGEQEGNGKAQREFWYKNESYGLLRFFFPGWAGMKVDENGNDNIEVVVRWILDTRKEKLESGAVDYWDFVQQYPLYSEEAFLTKGAAGIGNSRKIQEQINFLEKNPPRRDIGRFRWGREGEGPVVFIPNSEYGGIGKCIVYEHPSVTNLHSAGCDPADHDYVAKGSSDLSMYIMKRAKGSTPPRIVFSYTDRPEKVNDYYEQSLMALIYYGHTKILIENNRNGMIKYYESAGQLGLLKLEPTPKNTLVRHESPRIGVRKTVQSTKVMEGAINHYTDDYCDQIPDIDLLREFQVYGTENTDRAVAFGWTLVSMEDETDTLESIQTAKQALPSFRYRVVNGRTVRVKI
jgi:hypothetical protein